MLASIFAKLAMLLACLMLSGCFQGQTVVALGNDESGLHWVPVNVQGESAEFLLDTGSSVVALSEKFIARLPERPRTTLKNGRLVTSANRSTSVDSLPQRQLTYLQSARIDVGGMRFAGKGQILVLDTSPTEKIIGKNLDGVVGTALLNVSPWSIDFRNSLLALNCVADTARLPHEIEIRHGLLYATVSVDGLPVRVLVDSAATRSKISPATFERLPEEHYAVRDSMRRTVTADGVQVRPVQIVTVRKVVVGSARVHDFELLVDDADVIGLDILSLGELTLDPANSRFEFDTRPEFTMIGGENCNVSVPDSNQEANR